MSKEIPIIEGKTYLNADKFNALLVAIIGELTKADFRETNTAIEALWGIVLERPVRIARSDKRGTRVYINTPNKKRLAEAVLDEIRHYLGDQKNKPANTADEALILEHGNAWLQTVPDADWLNPQDYALYVCNSVDETLLKLNLDEAEHNAIVEAVQAWYDKQPLTAQPDEQAAPPAARPDADSQPDEQRPQPTNEIIGIDKEALRKHFNIKFQRDGYFDMLISDIAELKTQKDSATVAKMVFDSKGFIPTFSGFAAWCRAFFQMIGLSVPAKYNFSKYFHPTDKLTRKFYYLEKR